MQELYAQKSEPYVSTPKLWSPAIYNNKQQQRATETGAHVDSA